jgi:hypothetical protein
MLLTLLALAWSIDALRVYAPRLTAKGIREFTNCPQ